MVAPPQLASEMRATFATFAAMAAGGLLAITVSSFLGAMFLGFFSLAVFLVVVIMYDEIDTLGTGEDESFELPGRVRVVPECYFNMHGLKGHEYHLVYEAIDRVFTNPNLPATIYGEQIVRSREGSWTRLTFQVLGYVPFWQPMSVTFSLLYRTEDA